MLVAPLITEEMLDTLVITPDPVEETNIIEQQPYNPAADRLFDLLHTSLELRFDWEKQHVIGKATLDLIPVFYDQSTLMLDAKGFLINEITVDGIRSSYDYDGYTIQIELPKRYNSTQKLEVFIDYTARPNEGPSGGSDAITSDKGLFFINPLNQEDKPQQIWTQGETEHNSRWFPTIDKPNERCTQEIALTVEDRFLTLSNGSLISSTDNKDGTHTDVWKQDLPHAPYLFMITVGEYAYVKDMWEGKELGYYVEKEYAEHARKIFNHTPEMLTFFSEVLDYPYPWDKYSQIITRDYVSGAMENTTAVIFGEFVQKTDRELIDNDNDYIVAHEMFHHWFGDLVTCESWANLTLNEGFANYSEYLWVQYKYGQYRADDHRRSEMFGYLSSAQNQGTHPLIHFGYDDKEDMFDAHSYNKGGLVLHMLRDYVGDKAFFASLNKYLTDNAYTAVEVDELRMAFEDVTGLDLNWFFDQWYLSAGHPIIKTSYRYDTAAQQVIIETEQVQNDRENLPVYRLELTPYVYLKSGEIYDYTVKLDKRSQTIILPDVPSPPAAVVLDGNDSQLAVINQERPTEELLSILRFSNQYKDIYQAARVLDGSDELSDMFDILIKHDYHTIRVAAITNANLKKNPERRNIVKALVTGDPHSSVRSAAIDIMAYDSNLKDTEWLTQVIDDEKAYPVVAQALKSLNKLDSAKANSYAQSLEKTNNNMLLSAIAEIYGDGGTDQNLSFFERNLERVSLFSMFNFYNKYFKLLSRVSKEKRLSAVEALSILALDPDQNMFRRFMATSTIYKVKNSFGPEDTVAIIKTEKLLEKIISEEKDENLLSRYESFK